MGRTFVGQARSLDLLPKPVAEDQRRQAGAGSLVKFEGIEFGHAGAVASKASVIIHDKVTLNA